MTDTNNQAIAGFMLKGWYCFDSYAPFQIEWRGKVYPTVEHAYQAAHFFETSPELAEQVRQQPSPRLADDFANAHSDKEQANWSEVKVDIMREICKAQVTQHELIKQTLKESGDLEIVEMNDDDAFWGWGPDHHGTNTHGKVWMELREEFFPELSRKDES